jgi:hypothetical protein
MTIATFTLPRLRYLRKLDSGHPASLTPAEWQAILDEIIWTLEAVVDDSAWNTLEDRRQAGCELFGKHFQHLWD